MNGSFKSVYYQKLGTKGQKYYDQALQCMATHGRSFSPCPLNLTELLTMIDEDHPELFFVSKKSRVLTSGNFFSKTTTIIPEYLYSVSEARAVGEKLRQTADRIISREINDHQSEYDKVQVLHDYLKLNVEYDLSQMKNVNMADRRNAACHSIVGALLEHKCVCEGFAKAFKYLCDGIGIECWVVSGTGNSTIESGPHSWNIVKINGYYHHVDVTWDNQFADSQEVLNYGYLNLSDDEISRDHVWKRENYPACPDSPYNYFRVNDALIDSRAQLENFFRNNFEMEQETIMFKVVRGSLLEREINGCLDDCVFAAADKCRHLKVTPGTYYTMPEQLVYVMKMEYSY